jgi:hypothetical protein
MADANEREESPRRRGSTVYRIYTVGSLSSLVPRPGSGPGACGTYCTPLTGARSLARRRARGVRRRDSWARVGGLARVAANAREKKSQKNRRNIFCINSTFKVSRRVRGSPRARQRQPGQDPGAWTLEPGPWTDDSCQFDTVTRAQTYHGVPCPRCPHSSHSSHSIKARRAQRYPRDSTSRC